METEWNGWKLPQTGTEVRPKKGIFAPFFINIPPVRTEGSREKAKVLQWNYKTL